MSFLEYLKKVNRRLGARFDVYDYKNIGCWVYGAKWFEKGVFLDKDIHFFHENGRLIRTDYGYQFCVGTPDSFSTMHNVILENIRTAENMLIAYEEVMSGRADKLHLIAYAHGERGIEQYRKENEQLSRSR